MRNTVLVQGAGHDVEEAGELAEHQHTVPSGNDFAHKFPERGELGRLPGPAVLHKRHSAGGLAEPRDCSEGVHVHPRVLLKLILRLKAHGLVGEGLRGAHRDASVNLCLFRKFLDDLGLGPAQHEGLDYPLELRLPVLVLGVLYRGDELLMKALVAAEKPRVEELEEVPKLAEIVLHRSSGENHTRRRLERHGGVGHLCPPVLYGVGLVETDYVPLHGGKRLLFAHEQSVGSEHDVILPDSLERVRPVILFVQDHDVQGRRESRQLTGPVHEH